MTASKTTAKQSAAEKKAAAEADKAKEGSGPTVSDGAVTTQTETTIVDPEQAAPHETEPVTIVLDPGDMGRAELEARIGYQLTPTPDGA